MSYESQKTCEDLSLPRYDEFDVVSALDEFGTLFEINSSDYLIVGGASLVIRGIRADTEDIDILVSDKLFKALSASKLSKAKELPYIAQRNGDTNTSIEMYLWDSDMPLSITTHLPGNGTYPLLFEEVSKTAEIVKGFPCLIMDEMIASKSALARPKDIEDLKMIGAHIGRTLVIPKPSIQDYSY